MYYWILNEKDHALLVQLQRTGMTTSHMAGVYQSLREDELKRLEENLYIKRRKRIVKGINQELIQLGPRGKDYIKKRFNQTSFAIARTSHAEHDLKLTQMYNELPKSVQDTWVHEQQVLQEIYKKSPESRGQLTSCIDAYVVIGDEKIAIESIGYTYTKAIMEEKEAIAKHLVGCTSFESF